VVPLGQLTDPKFIINFPTKAHWRADSKLEHIEKGLVALVEEIKSRGIQSIAIPPLGCGNGGLAWSQVRPLIEAAFAPLADVRVLLFEPNAVASRRKMVDKTKRPNMTQGRAAVLCLMSRYLVPGYLYRLSMLEVQKLAYFMQEAGENLKLKFEKAPYGPYADDLATLNRLLAASQILVVRRSNSKRHLECCSKALAFLAVEDLGDPLGSPSTK